MRASAMLLGISSMLALVVGAATVHADCRYDCDSNFYQCNESCVGAQTYDDCTSACRSEYAQCLASCG